MKYLLLLSSLIFISLNTAFSQFWLDDLPNNKNLNFYEIQSNAYNYFSKIDTTEKGVGWKPFKRWEHFWEVRVYPTGIFPTSDYLMKEQRKFRQQYSNKKDNIVQSGNTWTHLGPNDSPGGYAGMGRVNAVRVSPYTGHIWAGSASGGLWKSTNGGTSWTTNTDNLDVMPSLGVTDIAFHPSNSNLMYIATGDANAGNTHSVGVLKSTNAGDTWVTTGLSWNTNQFFRISRLLINPNNPNIMFASTNGGVYKTTNAGNDWTQVLNGNFRDMEFKPNSPSTIYVSGSKFYKSTDNGENWTETDLGLANIRRIEMAVTKDSANYIYIVIGSTSNNLLGIYYSNDSGDSFTQLAGSTPNYLGYNKDGSGTGGQAGYDLCIEANPNDYKEVWIGGINIWKTTDAGSTWVNNTMWWGNHGVSTVHADQHDLWYDQNSDVLYLGNDGGVYKTSNGTDWDWIGSDLKITQFYRIGLSKSNSNLFIAGTQDNGSKIFKNGNWTDVIGGDGMECLVHHTNENILYGSIYYGSIRKTTNGGQSFKLINDLDNDNKYDDIDETGAWVTPYVMNPDNPNSIYVGMINLWKSLDGGDTFTKLTNFGGSTKLVNVAIAPSDTNVIYISTTSKLWRSTNNGNSWTEVSRPGNGSITYISVHDSNPNKLWASNSGYNASNRILESTNGGDSWTDISGNLPAIPVNCVIYQHSSNDKLWVATDLGVYVKDDNMGQWEEYNNGLPNVITRELEIHYSTNQLFVGTYGRGIWKVDIPSALAQVTLISPDNLSNGQSIDNLSLNWNTVSGATNYQLQFSKENNFSTNIIDTIISQTNFIISNLNNYENYYWRVRARASGTVGEWSSTRELTTIISTVSLELPNNNANGLASNLSLKWIEVTGAESYKLQVSSDNNFNNLLYDESIDKNEIEFDIDGLDNYTKYYWRVAAEDPSGIITDWSDVWEFTTIVAKSYLSLPSNQSKENDYQSLILEWNQTLGADDYKIQVSKNSNFSSITLDSNMSSNSINLESLEFFQTYYWRVRAANSGIYGEWSDIWSFRTKVGSMFLVTPEDESVAIDLNEITLNWSPISYADSFNLVISYNNNFDDIYLDISNLALNNHILNNLEYNKDYFWRLRFYAEDETSDWTSTFRFTTKLNTATLLSPVNNSNNVALNGELSWNSVNGASQYKLQISEFSNFSINLINTTINSNSYTYNNLEDNKKYYWRIQAINGDNYGDWSDIWTFRTPITKPVLDLPTNKTYNLNLESITLEWLEIAEADFYKLQVANDVNFSDLLINESNINALSYQFTPLEYGKEYWWKIKAITSGIESEWSESWSFGTILNNLSLISPLNNSENIDVNPELIWDMISTAESYVFEISKNQSLSPLLNYSGEFSTTSYKLNNLDSNTNYYWRVKAKSSIAESPWTETWQFKTIENIPDDANSVITFNNKAKVTLLPNPVNDNTKIEVSLSEAANVELSIYSLNGNIISNISSGYLSKGITMLKIDGTNYSNGAYILLINISGEKKVIKMIVQN